MTNHWTGADGSTATIRNVGTPESVSGSKNAVGLYFRPSSLPFWAIHVAALAGIFYTGWSWTGAALAGGTVVLVLLGLLLGARDLGSSVGRRGAARKRR